MGVQPLLVWLLGSDVFRRIASQGRSQQVIRRLSHFPGHTSPPLEYDPDDDGICSTCLQHRHVSICEAYPVGIHVRNCTDAYGFLKIECGRVGELLGYRPSGRCFGPDVPGPDLYCELGEPCEFTLDGLGMNATSYFTVSDGQCQFDNSSVLVRLQAERFTGETAHVTFNPMVSTVGHTWLCWSPFQHMSATIPAGFLHVGPIATSMSCTLGIFCYVNVSQLGSTQVDLHWSQAAVVIKGSESCDQHADLGTNWESTWLRLVVEDLDNFGLASFGTPSHLEMVGKSYSICWQNDRNQKYVILPEWGLSGPSLQDARPNCVLGIPCEITLSGYQLGTLQDMLSVCSGYVAEMIQRTPASNAATFSVIFNFESALFAPLQEPLCWQAPGGAEFQVGIITLTNDCPQPSDSWPNKESSITLSAGKSQEALYVTSDCKDGDTCTGCIEASSQGTRFNRSGFFALADDEMKVSSCSSELLCSAEACVIDLVGEAQVGTGAQLTATAYVYGNYECRQGAQISVVAFGCQEGAVMTFMAGVALVLLVTVVVGLALEAIAKASVKTYLEGSFEILCTGKEQPSLVALRSCVTQSVAPDRLQWFSAWSSGPLVLASFQLSSVAKPVRHWVTELPGLCRVDAASMRKVQQPGRLPGAGILELAEAAAAGCSRESQEDKERLHFEFATALLRFLRRPIVQALLIVQFTLMMLTAIGLPLLATQMMDDCAGGYPIFLHCMWGVFQLVQGFFWWFLLRRSCPDRELSKRFMKQFSLRLFAGWCVGTVSQTDIYMDLTFPVIARKCNFELWIVAAWLCALGIGIGQVGQSLCVIVLGKVRASRAVSPERRERAELSVLFFLLRVTDNVALCFAVRPVLDQRIGGSSSWAARVAEARVPFARFLFEDVEQSALQVIFLVFFDVATASDIVWIALSITTSLLLSLLLMVQVLPEVRDWIWYRLLAVVRRPFRLPLLFTVFVVYRLIASAPWLFACSSNVEDTTFLGFRLRQQVINEVFAGLGMTTASLFACCVIVYAIWKCQVQPPPKFQPPLYDVEARFKPKAFGAWSTEQDQWLEPLRECFSQDMQPARRSALEAFDHQLFKLRHGLTSRMQATELGDAEAVPDAVSRCVERVLALSRLRKLVQQLLKNRRFTGARFQKKGMMIDRMAEEALSSTLSAKGSTKDFFRLLPYRALKNGIPLPSDGCTVNVSQAQEQAGSRRLVVIAVSHCWLSVDSSPPHPDNRDLDKARSLTQFAEWYKQYWGEDIEVFYWIDYSCIDHENCDISVVLLPVLIASCTAMVLWRTSEYEARSWTAMERVLAYSYCEGGLTPYIIDGQFTNQGQEPRWEPWKLPDPLSNSSTAMTTNASDKHLIEQLLQCVFAVPAFEVFPDRQSISFGQTEVVHLDLSCREPLRSADTAADGFFDGVDKRVWVAAADKPPVTNTGMKVRTKEQVALLMPADVADTFVPTRAQKAVATDFTSLVANIEGLLSSNRRPSESDVASLLELLEDEAQTAMRTQDEQRLMRALEISQRFGASPPAVWEARRHLCRPQLSAALKGSDRILRHALQLAQQYGVDTDDFTEFRLAVAEQERRRVTQLHAELEKQLKEADISRDDALMFAVWQAADKAAKLSDNSDAFSNLATDAIKLMTYVISEKLEAPGVSEDADRLQSVLEMAEMYGVEKSPAAEDAAQKLREMCFDPERIKSSISTADKAEDEVGGYCQEVLQKKIPLFVLRPGLAQIIDWGLEQRADQLQEVLRAVTILGLPQEDPLFKTGVDKLKELLILGLPDDWDILRQEWSQAHLSVQQVKVEDKQLRDAIQALLDESMAGWDVVTCDRIGDAPTRLKVQKVTRVQHPGNYLRYKTCRTKMMESLRNKEGFVELGAVKTEVVRELPDLFQMELSAAVNEVVLFHGTDHHAADGIAAQGFRIDLSGSASGSMFGRGAYFAERCLKSDEYARCAPHNDKGQCCNTERPLLICRVLLGKFKYTDEGYPNSASLEEACLSGDCDSVLADREMANIKRGFRPSYREFVVFDPHQVYPDYVVWYTRSFKEKPPEILSPALSPSRRPPTPMLTSSTDSAPPDDTADAEPEIIQV